ANFFGRSAVGAAAFNALFSNGIESFQAFIGDVAEVGVIRSQGGISVVQEELRTVGISAGIGHGDRTAWVDGLNSGVVHLIGGVLVGELEARSAGARTGWVTTLQHGEAAGGHTVADGVVVVALINQISNGVDRTRCERAVQFHRDFALVGRQVHGNRAFSGDIVTVRYRGI